MSLEYREKEILLRVVQRLDAKAALALTKGELESATTLAVFSLLRDVVRPLDPKFADGLVAQASEDAAAKIAGKAITAEINAETKWVATGGQTKGES